MTNNGTHGGGDKYAIPSAKVYGFFNESNADKYILDNAQASPLCTPLAVRETEILVEKQPPQGVLVCVCDHAGVVINKFSIAQVFNSLRTQARLSGV